MIIEGKNSSVSDFLNAKPTITDIHTRQPLVDGAPEEECENSTAADILKKCLEVADSVEDILIMTCDRNGVLGFSSNCETLAEAVLFMEIVKAQALFSRVGTSDGGSKA
jgi:hypothetical protein